MEKVLYKLHKKLLTLKLLHKHVIYDGDFKTFKKRIDKIWVQCEGWEASRSLNKIGIFKRYMNKLYDKEKYQ